MIESLTLKNFTSFEHLEINFSPKINVIIGENGTGKTHLLKTAYALSYALSGVDSSSVADVLTRKLVRLFMPLEEQLGKLHRRGAREQASIQATFFPDQAVSARFFNNSKRVQIDSGLQQSHRPVFIPTKEVLSLAKGMTHKSHDRNTVELIFDDGYIDLAKNLENSPFDDPEVSFDLDPRLGTIVPKLVNLIGGRYKWINGEFCFESGSYSEKSAPPKSKSKQSLIYSDATVLHFEAGKEPLYSSSMTAEGFRKIGILHRLLCNASIYPGKSGPLFWDEPESNLNPKLMKLLVEILLELSRNGQQVILATHDYVLLKWMDLLFKREKGDHIQFHILSKDTLSNKMTVESSSDYSLISKSAISDTFAELYDADIQRALGD